MTYIFERKHFKLACINSFEKNSFLFYHLLSRLYQLSLSTGNQSIGASFWIIHTSSSVEAVVIPIQTRTISKSTSVQSTLKVIWFCHICEH